MLAKLKKRFSVWRKGPESEFVHPFNFGGDEFPVLVEGDKLMIVLQNQKYDYISGIVYGKDKSSPPGTKRIWTVIKAYNDDYLCELDSDRILLKYLTWVEDNMVKLESTFIHGEEFYRFYYCKK